MTGFTRREFFENSLITAAALAASQASVPWVRAANDRRSSANETIRHAVIGCGIHGRNKHAREFAGLPGVDVAYVCDPDRQRVEETAAVVTEQQGRRPKAVQDLRVIVDDPSIDTVSIAAPNHWHALAAIWAMQAGKDVYVEKPVSHNISEGRRIVQVARRTNRICQTGTQRRSRGDLAAAAQYIRDGKLGEVTLGRTIMYKRRESLGPAGVFAPPLHVDFNLWLGPATQETITRQNFHYDWHFFWDTGNGEIGNNSIHAADLCRWLMGLEGFGDSVFSLGTRTFDDAGETPSTQIAVHTFGPATIVQEVRNLRSEPFSKEFRGGHVIYGSGGIIAGGSLFDPDGKLVKTFRGPDQNHYENFINAVRSGRREDLTAEILEGHQSSAMPHAANISYRLGRPAAPEEVIAGLDSLGFHSEVRETFNRTLAHLQSHHVDLDKTPLRIGPLLRIDPKSESFVDNAAANALLSREYRPGFVVPSETEV